MNGLSNALADKGVVGILNTALPKLTGSLSTITSAFSSASGAAGYFGAALTSLTTPLGIVVAITGAVVALSKAWDWYNNRYDDAKNQSNKSFEEYEKAKSDLEGINEELQTTKDRMSELQSQGALTLADQAELESLRLTNAELERKKKLQEQLVADSNAKAEKDTIDAINSTGYKDGVGGQDTISNVVHMYEKQISEDMKSLEEQKRLLEHNTNEKTNHVYESRISGLESSISNTKELLSQAMSDVDDYAEKLSGTTTEKGKEALAEMNSLIDEYLNFSTIGDTPLQHDLMTLQSFFEQTTSGNVLKDKILEIMESGSTAEEAMHSLGLSIDSLGLNGETAVSSLNQYFKDLAVSAKESASAVEQVKEATTSASDIEAAIKTSDVDESYKSLQTSWKTMEAEFNSGKYGTDQARTLLSYFTGENIDENTSAKKVKEKYDAIKKKVKDWYATDNPDNGDRNNPDVAWGAKQFINDLNATGVANLNFENRTAKFNESIKTTKDLADKLGVSVQVVEDNLSNLESFGFDFDNEGFAMAQRNLEEFAATLDGLKGIYSSMEDGTQGKTALGQLIEEYQKQLDGGNISNQLLLKINFEYDNFKLQEIINSIQAEIDSNKDGGTSLQYDALNDKKAEQLRGKRRANGYKDGDNEDYDKLMKKRKALLSMVNDTNAESVNVDYQKQASAIADLQNAFQDVFSTLDDKQKESFDWNKFLGTDEAKSTLENIKNQYGNLEEVFKQLDNAGIKIPFTVDKSELEKVEEDVKNSPDHQIKFSANVDGIKQDIYAVQNEDGTISYKANVGDAVVELKAIETSQGTIFVTANTSEADAEIEESKDKVESVEQDVVRNIVDPPNLYDDLAKISQDVNRDPKNPDGIFSDLAPIKQKVERYVSTINIGGTDLGGTTHLGGTAYAGGSNSSIGLDYSSMPSRWKTKKDDNPLVGEEGQELVATRDGYWYTVGDNGAEFTSIPKGSVVFDADQTKKLLRDGHINSRGSSRLGGSAYLSGTAYKSGTNKNNKKSTNKDKTDKKLEALKESLSVIESLASYNSDLGKFGSAVNNYMSAIKKAFSGISKVAKKSVQEVRKSISDYIKSLKQARDEQLKTKVSAHEMFNSIASANSIDGNPTAMSTRMQNSQLDFENKQLGKSNEDYKTNVENVNADTNKIRSSAKSSVNSALKKAKKNSKYEKALKNAKKAMNAKKKVASADLKVIKSKNKTVHAKLLAYNQQIDNLRDAKLEASLNYSQNVDQQYKNIIAQNANKNNLAKSNIDLLLSKADNAKTAEEAMQYMEQASKEYDKIVANDRSTIEALDKDVDTATNTISKSSGQGAILKDQTSAKQKEVKEFIGKIKERVASGKEITAGQLAKLADYYKYGLVSKAFYFACVDYNTALSAREEAQALLEIDEQTAQQNKREIANKKFNDAKSRYESKRGLIDSKISKNESIINSRAGSYEKKKQAVLDNVELSKERVALLQEERDELQKIYDAQKDVWSAEEKAEKEAELNELDAELENINDSLLDAKKAILDLDLQRIQHEIDEIEASLSKLEHALSRLDMRDSFDEASYSQAYQDSLARTKEELVGLYEEKERLEQELATIDKEENPEYYYEISGLLNDTNERIEDNIDKQLEFNLALEDLPLKMIEKLNSLLGSIVSYYESLIDLQVASGKVISAADYQQQINALNNQRAKQQEAQNYAYQKWQEAKRSDDGKATDKDGESYSAEHWEQAYYEAATETNRLSQNIVELKDEIANLEIVKLEHEFDRLSAQMDKLRDSITLLETKGILPSASDYQALISQSKQQQASLQQRKRAIQNRMNNVGVTDPDQMIEVGSEKYYELQDQIDQIDSEIRQASIDQAEWNNQIANLPITKLERTAQLLESIAEYNKSLIELKSAKGQDLTIGDYKQQMSDNEDRIANLQRQVSEVNNAYNKARSSSEGVYGGKSAEEWQTELYNLKSEINSVTIENEELKDSMREDVEFRSYRRAVAELERLRTELEIVRATITDDDMYDKSTGALTNKGTTALYLAQQELKSYEKEVATAQSKIAKIKSMKGRDGYSEDEYLSDLADAEEALLSAINGEMDARDKIKNIIQKSIEMELDAVDKLIDKWKDALDVQKEIYDYGKNIKKQAQEVANIEKQLMSLQGDDSEENQARLQQLKVSYQDAQDALYETEFEHYISEQKKLVDELTSQWQENMSEYVDYVVDSMGNISSSVISGTDILNGSFLDGIDRILDGNNNGQITDAINNGTNGITDGISGIGTSIGGLGDIFNGGFSGIYDWFKTLLEKFGFSMDADSMVTNGFMGGLFGDLGKIMNGDFSELFANGAKWLESIGVHIDGSTNSLVTGFKDMASKWGLDFSGESFDIQSLMKNLNDVTKNFMQNGFGGMQDTFAQFMDKYGVRIDDRLLYNADVVSSALEKLGVKSSDNIINIINNLRDINNSIRSINIPSPTTSTGYAKGTKRAKEDFAWTQEDGGEIIRTSDGALLTPVKNNMIFDNESSMRLWDIAHGDYDLLSGMASEFYRNLAVTPQFYAEPEYVNNGGNITVGDVQVVLDGVQNPQEFADAFQSEFYKILSTKRGERAVQSVTTDRLSGGSTISKYKR